MHLKLVMRLYVKTMNDKTVPTVNYQLKVNDKTYLPHYHKFILLAQSKTAMSLFAQKFGGYLLRTFS